MKLGILTISDSVPIGRRVDTTGPKIREILSPFFEAVLYEVSTDNVAEITSSVTRLLSAVTLLMTNGGTGMMERDNTGKALAAIDGTRLSPLERAVSAAMILKCGPLAAISSPVVLKKGGQYIIALPGRTEEAAAALTEVIKPFVLAHIVFAANDQIKR